MAKIWFSFVLIVLQSFIIALTRGCVGEEKDLTVVIDSTKYATSQDFSLQKSFIDILLNEMNKTKFRLSVQVYSDANTCQQFSDDFEKTIRLLTDRDKIRSRLDTLKYKKSMTDYDLACIKSLLSSHLAKDNSIAFILATNQSVKSDIGQTGKAAKTSRLVCLLSTSSTESYRIVQMVSVEDCIRVLRKMICGEPQPSISFGSSLQYSKATLASSKQKLDSMKMMSPETPITYSSAAVDSVVLASVIVSSSTSVSIATSSSLGSKTEATPALKPFSFSNSVTSTTTTQTFVSTATNTPINSLSLERSSSIAVINNRHQITVPMVTTPSINTSTSKIQISQEGTVPMATSPSMIKRFDVSSISTLPLSRSIKPNNVLIKQSNSSRSSSHTPILSVFQSVVTMVTKPLLKPTLFKDVVSSSFVVNASEIPSKKEIQGKSSSYQSKSKAYPFVVVSEQLAANRTAITSSDVWMLPLNTVTSSISSIISFIPNIKTSRPVPISNGSSLIPRLQPSVSFKNNISSSAKTPALQVVAVSSTGFINSVSRNASTASIMVTEIASVSSNIVEISTSISTVAAVPVQANSSTVVMVNQTQLPVNASKRSMVLSPSTTSKAISSNASVKLVSISGVNNSRNSSSMVRSLSPSTHFVQTLSNYTRQQNQSMENFSLKSSAIQSTPSFNKSSIQNSTTPPIRVAASSITLARTMNSSMESSLIKQPVNNTLRILPSTLIISNVSFIQGIASSRFLRNISINDKNSSMFHSTVFVGSIALPPVDTSNNSSGMWSHTSSTSSLVLIASSWNKSITSTSTKLLPWKLNATITTMMNNIVPSYTSHHLMTSATSILQQVSTSPHSLAIMSTRSAQTWLSSSFVSPQQSTRSAVITLELSSNLAISASPTSRVLYLNSSAIFVPPKKEKKLLTDMKRFMTEETTSEKFSDFVWVKNFVEESSSLLDQLQYDNSSEIMNNSLPLVQYLEDIFISVARHTSKTKGRRFKSNELSIEVKPLDTKSFDGYIFKSDNTGKSVKEGEEGVFLQEGFFDDQIVNDNTAIVVMEYKPLPVMTSDDSFKVADKVFVINIEPPLQTPFKRPFKYVIDFKTEPKHEVQCVYWNERSWDTKGCETTKKVNSSLVVCECNHMTPFSVLMQVKDYEIPEVHQFALSLITYIGCGVSIAACLVLVLSFMMCGKLVKIDRNIIHINLAIAIALSNALFIIADSVYKYKHICLGVSIAMLYTFLSSFFWMLVEGMHVYLMVVKVFRSSSKVTVYMLTGWFLPAVIVTIAAVKYHQHFVRPNFCWISTDHFLVWIFVGPALFVLTVNTIILITTLSASHKMCLNEVEFHKLRQVARLTLLLMPVFGLSWVFGVLAVNKETIIFQYIFTGLNSFQGLFLFICYCLMNSEVRREYDRVRRKSAYSSKSNGFQDSAFSTYTHYSANKHGRPSRSSALSSEDVPSSVMLTRYDPDGDEIKEDIDDDENSYPGSVSNTLTKRHKKNYSIELVRLPNTALSDEENLEEPTDVTGLLTVNDKNRDTYRSSTFSERSSRQDRSSSIDDLLRTEGNVYKTFQNQEDGTYALAYFV